MSKEILVIAMGVWITFVPHLGIPGSWRTALLTVTGILLVVLGFFLRTEVIARTGRGGKHEHLLPFEESDHIQTDEPHSPHLHERKERITSLN